MIVVLDPISNPLGFLALYFFIGIGSEGIIGLFKITLFTSVLLYPFILIGNLLVPKIKGSHLSKLFITTFAITLFFWIVIRIWYVLAGSEFVISNIGSLIVGFIVSLIGAFIFVLIGDFLLEKIRIRWKLPTPLSLFILDYFLCLLIWALLWVKILIFV